MSTSLILGLPLPLRPSTFPITQTLSSCLILITWPRNLSCRCLIVLINSLPAPARCKTASLVTRSVHGILNILLYSHISTASIFLSISLLMFHASQPNKSVDHIYDFMNLLRRLTEIALFVTRGLTLLNAVLAMAIRAFISSVHLPS